VSNKKGEKVLVRKVPGEGIGRGKQQLAPLKTKTQVSLGTLQVLPRIEVIGERKREMEGGGTCKSGEGARGEKEMPRGKIEKAGGNTQNGRQDFEKKFTKDKG